MNTNELKEIITIIEQSEIDVLQLEQGDFKLYYEKQNAQKIRHEQNNPQEQKKEDKPLEAVTDVVETDTKAEGTHHTITSPMIGTFYARPNPESEPFVQVGTTIAKDDPVCILEAMKLLNEIRADVAGEIVDILVADGDIIEYGQSLFTVKVSE